MKNRLITGQEKESIIAEYLLGSTSFRILGKMHGIDFRVIHSWVTNFKGKTVRHSKKTNPPKALTEELSSDVKLLQEELRKARLHNDLLNAMIDIAEEQLKINIRKKSGTKR